jgi:hypothetical protein
MNDASTNIKTITCNINKHSIDISGYYYKFNDGTIIGVVSTEGYCPLVTKNGYNSYIIQIIKNYNSEYNGDNIKYMQGYVDISYI